MRYDSTGCDSYVRTAQPSTAGPSTARPKVAQHSTAQQGSAQRSTAKQSLHVLVMTAIQGSATVQHSTAGPSTAQHSEAQHTIHVQVMTANQGSTESTVPAVAVSRPDLIQNPILTTASDSSVTTNTPGALGDTRKRNYNICLSNQLGTRVRLINRIRCIGSRKHSVPNNSTKLVPEGLTCNVTTEV